MIMLLKIMNISLLITTSIVGTSAQHHIRKLGYGGCNYLKIAEILENGGHRESDACATEDGTMYELRLSRQFKRDLNNGLISGETNLHIPRAIIDGRVIRVPPNAAINLRKTRSLQNTKRTLQTTGTKRVFIVKDTSVTMYDTTQVSDDVFGTNGDAVNLKTHFAQCSYNQLLFEPFIGETSSGEYITNGVGEVTIDMNALASSDRYVVHEAVLAAANSKYGNVQQQFDYVMLILPPTTDFKESAYAYVNGFLSVYHHSCALMSMVQMHEMGHNLNLAHSGEGSATYGDQSGCMGVGLWTDDYSGCFNGAKSWQLGWYTDSYYSFNPTLTYFKRGIVGISDYSTRGGSHSHTVIELVGSTIELAGSTTNFYVAFNRKSGMNFQTQEGGDQVLVTKYKGTGYGASDLVAKLGANQEYCFDFTQVDIVCVKVDAISLSADAYADITIALQGQDTTSPNPPTTRTGQPALSPATVAPTLSPTLAPTLSPTLAPTLSPTLAPTLSPPTVAPIKAPTSTSSCTDSSTSCAYWAGLNYCTEKYVYYMTQFCKKSCNICGSSCTDSSTSCAYWAGLNYCTEKYVGYMTKSCKKSCNICGSSSTVAPTLSPTLAPTLSPPTVAPIKAPTSTSSCTDSSTSCAYWAGLNYCTEKYVGYMTENCKKSCNICGSSCTDSSKSCAYWAGLNYCTEKYVDYMTKSCKKSCNICGSSCTDSSTSCAYWAGLNYCTEKYVGYMTKSCKKSCNIC